MMMMIMYFHFRIEEVILFAGWIPKTLLVYILSCFAVSGLSFLYELLRFGHNRLNEKLFSQNSGEIEESLLGSSSSYENQKEIRHKCLPTILYFVEMFLSYSLMMIAMTYNVPIVISMIAGHIVAYFLLTPALGNRQEQNLGECCQ